jgi:hypothetical protein
LNDVPLVQQRKREGPLGDAGRVLGSHCKGLRESLGGVELQPDE